MVFICSERVLAAETMFAKKDGSERPDFLLPIEQLRKKLEADGNVEALKGRAKCVLSTSHNALLQHSTRHLTRSYLMRYRKLRSAGLTAKVMSNALSRVRRKVTEEEQRQCDISTFLHQ